MSEPLVPTAGISDLDGSPGPGIDSRPGIDPSPRVDPAAALDIHRRLASAASRPDGDVAVGLAWAHEVWSRIPRDCWPTLFELLNVAADLPRLAGNASLANLSQSLWPNLGRASDELIRLQALVDTPIVPEGSSVVESRSLADALDEARRELEEHHCVTVEDLFDASARQALDREIERLAVSKMGSWGALERGESPTLFELFETALAGTAFHRLTGWLAGRDEFSLTLSLQDLQPEGIGWHRDLYWPEEWVGEDVFAVLYALGDDTPQKGGAFTYYVPWHDRLAAVYRRRHQATVLWNAAATEGRLLHAVSGYHGTDTSRHLVILQCLRRGNE